jgi:hypothetical protein
MPITLSRYKDNQKITTDLTKIRDFSELRSNLQAMQPPSSEMTQVITYALIATAVVGIFVYNYIKQQESFAETSQNL